MEFSLNSDFAAARLHLHRAYDYLCGSDEVSHKSRMALDLLIEAVVTAECTQPRGEIIPFPKNRRARGI